MSKKRSDALTALVAEVVDLRAEYQHALDQENEARSEWTAARQVVDSATATRTQADERLTATREALGIVQRRDEVADDVVEALIARQEAR